MTLEANKYKIYYYLNNLWGKKYNEPITPISYLSILHKYDKCEYGEHDNLLKKYKNLIELSVPVIEYDKYKKIFTNNLHLIKKIGYTKYYKNNFDITYSNFKLEGNIENNINVITELITESDIKTIYIYFISSIEIKKNIIKPYIKSHVIPINKTKNDQNKPNELVNFRYITNHHNIIKIIDRLWCIKLLSYFNTYPINKNIFKSDLLDQDFAKIMYLTCVNTCSLENIVLLDITNAYDSIDWDTLERLLYANLSRKIDKNICKTLILEYMIILKNKIVYHNDLIINVLSGIPTGLPSSKIVFHFVMEEIILRWLYINEKYTSNFTLNIFMDDIYFKFNEKICVNEINYLIINLINYFKKFGLQINRDKLKFSHNIYTKKIGKILSDKDLYLGIPFTRNIQIYGQIILNQFNDRYNGNLSWHNIYDYILIHMKCSNSLLSYFSFKLKPIIGIRINKFILLKFIKTNYLCNYTHL